VAAIIERVDSERLGGRQHSLGLRFVKPQPFEYGRNEFGGLGHNNTSRADHVDALKFTRWMLDSPQRERLSSFWRGVQGAARNDEFRKFRPTHGVMPTEAGIRLEATPHHGIIPEKAGIRFRATSTAFFCE